MNAQKANKPFRVCPICHTVVLTSRIEVRHTCPYCKKTWEAPHHSIADAYYIDASEVHVLLQEPLSGFDYEIPEFPAELGRLSEFKVLQMNRAVSRNHFRIECKPTESSFTVIPYDTPGGTFLNGVELPANQEHALNNGDKLNIAGVELGVRFLYAPQQIEQHSATNTSGSDIELLPGLNYIIRTEDGDLAITNKYLPSSLALIYRTNSKGGIRILSLNRSSVAINGQRFLDNKLKGGDHLLLGDTLYIYNAAKSLLEVVEQGTSGGIHLADVYAGYGKENVLEGLTADIPQGKLTAIIGQSGCGKTTLLKILTGSKHAENGYLRASTQSDNEDYAEWAENNIALVPQFNTLHGELTVRQCVSYAAEIRLKGSRNKKNKEAFIIKSLQETGLLEYEHKRIDELSGGQLKRVNIAVETVAQPGVLILDEPTTGLDYATEKQIIAVLKQMTLMGRTIVFVTHSLSTVQEADHVIMLHRMQQSGTKVIAEGTPNEALKKLNSDDWGTAFEYLENNTADTTHQALNSAQNSSRVGIPVLIRRYLRIWRNTPRTSTIFFLGMPLVLGLLIRMAVSIDYPIGADRLVFGLVAMFWLGMNQTVREIVKERAIFLLERAHHITSLQYLSSKFICFILITFIQAIVMAAPILLLDLSPEPGWLNWNQLHCGYTSVASQMWLGGLAGCAMGLFGSALSLFVKGKGEVAAVLFAVLLTLPQLLFSEKVIPDGLARAREVTDYYSFTMWHDVAPIAEFVSYFTFSRYLYMPLDAISHLRQNTEAIQKAFIFNDGIILSSIFCILILTWLVLELYVARSKH